MQDSFSKFSCRNCWTLVKASFLIASLEVEIRTQDPSNTKHNTLVTEEEGEVQMLHRFALLWSDWQQHCYTVLQFSFLATIPSVVTARIILPSWAYGSQPGQQLSCLHLSADCDYASDVADDWNKLLQNNSRNNKTIIILLFLSEGVKTNEMQAWQFIVAISRCYET